MPPMYSCKRLISTAFYRTTSHSARWRCRLLEPLRIRPGLDGLERQRRLEHRLRSLDLLVNVDESRSQSLDFSL